MSDNPILSVLKLCASVVLAFAVTGCALTPNNANRSLVLGEHVSYRVVNLAGESVLQMPILSEVGSGQVLFSTLALASKNPQRPNAFRRYQEFEPSPAMLPVRVASADSASTALTLPDVFGQDPGDENLSLPPASVDVSAVMPNGHRIAQTVELSWRRAPKPGQAVYLGEKTKPIVLPLRSRIPAWALSQVSDQWRYRLDIDVLVNGPGTATLRWRVMCFSEGSLHEIARGGKWH